MAILSKLVVSLQTNHAKFSQGMDTAGRKLQGFRKTAGFAKKALTGLFAIGGGVGFAALIKNTIDTADELAKLSERTGVSVESLSTLEHAAQLSGATMEDVSKAVKGVAVAALEANNGLKTYTRIFDQLDVEFKNGNGTLRNTEAIIFDVANRFKNMEDGTKKTALAVRLFGRAGQNLIPLLNQGADGIRRMQDEARDLGLEITQETAEAAEQFNDDLLRLKNSLAGTGRAMTAELLEPLTNVSKAMAQAAKDEGLLTSLFIGFGGAIHEMAGGELGQIEREISQLEGSLQSLRRASDVAIFTKSIDEWLGIGGNEDLDQRIAEVQKKLENLRQARELLINPPEDDKPEERDTGPGIPETDPTIQKKFDSFIEKLEREKALISDNSKLSQIRYDLESGKLSELNASQKERILDLAEEIDFIKAIAEADKLAAEEMQERIDQQNEYNESLEVQANELRAQFDPLSVLNKEMARLDELLERNLISWEVWASATQEAIDGANEKVEELDGTTEDATDKITEYSLEAARNIQDSFADFLFDPFDQGVQGMIESFELALRRMAANAAAARLAEKAFGDFASTGEIGGYAGDFLKFIAGRAGGGRVSQNSPYMVGENGPELFVPDTAGSIDPNPTMSGISVVNNFTIQGDMTRESQAQIAARVGQSVNRAVRRNT